MTPRQLKSQALYELTEGFCFEGDAYSNNNTGCTETNSAPVGVPPAWQCQCRPPAPAAEARAAHSTAPHVGSPLLLTQACTGILENWIYSGNYELISTFSPTNGGARMLACKAAAPKEICLSPGTVCLLSARFARAPAAEMARTDCTGPGTMAECMSAACYEKEGSPLCAAVGGHREGGFRRRCSPCHASQQRRSTHQSWPHPLTCTPLRTLLPFPQPLTAPPSPATACWWTSPRVRRMPWATAARRSP